jgi:ATP-dependent Clp protease ATP-binding subunit ClpC
MTSPTTLPRTADLVEVLRHARDIAEESEQSVGSIHLLLALFVVQNPAEEALRRRGIDEDRLLGALREAPNLYDEPSDTIERLDDALRSATESTAHESANCLHLLAALTRVQSSSAYLLLKRLRIDVTSLRTQVLALLSVGPAGGLHARATSPGSQNVNSVDISAAVAEDDDEPARVDPSSPPSKGAAPSAAGPRDANGGSASVPTSPRELSREAFPNLAQFGRNLTAKAAAGHVDPIVGREAEVEKLLDILSKRRANNPCLIGEPGVGKTAVVELLAQRLLAAGANGALEGRVIIELDLGGVLAGTQLRGSLQERLDGIKREVREAAGRVIIFIDELHTLVGAGATGEGAQDAANELKAALARGEFPCIGATTPGEYRKHIENDPALARRFQPVFLEEPTQAQALAILRGTIASYAEHHNVPYEDDALEASVRLSVRYLRDRRLPDKALNVVDLAGARARREGRDGVGRDDVARVVASLAHLPEEKLLLSDNARLMRLEETLGRSLVGHADVVRTVASTLRRASAGFTSRRPMGAFLFLGPTGVGKTELARLLADALFEGRDAIVRFDMSEFAEPHTLARLVGAPPGYVGHEDGGQLTEAVRRRPYSLVLLDEVEKAHRDVLQLLLQVLDEGRLSDAQGRVVDFTSTVVVLTSNLGSEHFRAQRRVGFETGAGESTAVARAVLDTAKRALNPELWNRIEHRLVFSPLGKGDVREIARRQLSHSAQTLSEERGISYRVDEAVLDWLVERGGFDVEMGARPMRQTIERTIEGELAHRILLGELKHGDVIRVSLDANRELAFAKES